MCACVRHAVWHYTPPNGLCQQCPSLEDDALFGTSDAGYAYKLDLATGRELWSVKYSDRVGGDTAYVQARDGVVVVAGTESRVVPHGQPVNQQVFGLDAADGHTLCAHASHIASPRPLPRLRVLAPLLPRPHPAL